MLRIKIGFYIWVFLITLNLFYWEKGWLRKGKKIMVIFLGTIIGLKGKITSFLINFLGKFRWHNFFQSSFYSLFYDVRFSTQILIYIYISFQNEKTSKNLIICIPILLKWKKKFMGFYVNLKDFFTLYLTSFYWLNVLGLLLFILVRLWLLLNWWLLWLSGGYYCGIIF